MQHNLLTDGDHSIRWAWWRRRGEAGALGLLLAAAWGVVLLTLLEVIDAQRALRLGFGLGWLAIGLLLLRGVPTLFAHRHLRTRLLSAVCLSALVGALLSWPLSASYAEPTRAEVLSALGDVTVYSPLQQSAAQLTFVAASRITKETFRAVLERGTGGGVSPAAPSAAALYDIIVGYGLDPAVALAFFSHESQLCTRGVCQVYDTHGWGNMRAAYNRARVVDVVQVSSGPFVRYGSWEDGTRDWCELILNRYVGRGYDTVAKAVPIYAPTSDGNVPTSYINNIYRMVSAWSGRDLSSPATADAARSYSDSLDVALIKETFLANDLEYHAGWAFHQYVITETRAGRPLGVPMGESQRVQVGNKFYAVQVFALDTLYTPLATVESETTWSDVRRLSGLIKLP